MPGTGRPGGGGLPRWGPGGFAVEKWTLGEAAFDAQWGMFRVKLQAHCRGWLVARTQESGEIVGFAVKGEVVL
mgnify:CR=1 FL=1